MTDTIKRFADGLKAKLRAGPFDPNQFVADYGGMGSTMTGWMSEIEVDWDELDKAIDEFAASFEKERKVE